MKLTWTDRFRGLDVAVDLGTARTRVFVRGHGLVADEASAVLFEGGGNPRFPTRRGKVLAVGDAAFRRKSLARMKDIAASGRTILFVSHSMGNIRDICSRCLWFDHGRVRMDGPTKDVADAYEKS